MIQRSNDADLPERILEALESRVTEHQFLTWFKEVRVTLHAADQVVVHVPNRFHLTYIRHRFLSTISEVVGEVLNIPHPAVEFVIPEGTKPRLAEVDAIPLNEEYTFEEFVVGPSNRLAHAAAVAVSENPGHAYNPFFVHGPVGLGKTHLLQAIAHRYQERGIQIVYLSCASFVSDFIRSVERGTQEDFRERFRQAGALLIDDVQLLADKERTQEEFFHTFNAINNQKRQIVLTSDSPPTEIHGVEDRLISRFRLGLVAPLDPPSFETRVAILMRKCRNLGLQLPPDVAEFVCKSLRDNVRELEGAALRLHSIQRIENLELTIENVRTSLSDLLASATPRGIDMLAIIETVKSYYSVPVEALKSKRRNRSVVVPRQICMFLARKHTDYSLNEIGGHFGGRDHSTVLHSIEKIETERQRDPDLNEAIQSIENKLQ